ncbi:MAG TPA: hypothetical protein VHT05_14315 [Candidatus Elarobacter sp.]|nr:hypothetical protein [Candidatus Elarobacter sp.]
MHARMSPAVTYSSTGPVRGSRFTCRRCEREYRYPVEGGPPVRCECGWWYTNTGHGLVEEFRPRIGGAKTSGPEKAAEPGSA